jgi:hypothetical protein
VRTVYLHSNHTIEIGLILARTGITADDIPSGPFSNLTLIMDHTRDK